MQNAPRFGLEGHLFFLIGVAVVDRKHQLRCAGTHGLNQAILG